MDIYQALISMFIILGPFANIFIFESILDNLGIYDKKLRQYAIKRAFLLAYLIWLPIFLFGIDVLKLFGISLKAFQIAGGIVLALIAYDILHSNVPRMSKLEHSKEELNRIIATPMAVPLLTGPGAITTTLLYKASITTLLDTISLFFILSLAYLLAFLVVYNGEELVRKFGKTVLLLLNKLMGLILLAIAVEFIINVFII